jgi:hypothetical protein
MASNRKLQQDVTAPAVPHPLPEEGLDSELVRSCERLKALRVLIGIEPSGEIHICTQGSAEANDIASAGGTLYTPEEMYLFVRLNDRERRLVRELKGLR